MSTVGVHPSAVRGDTPWTLGICYIYQTAVDPLVLVDREIQQATDKMACETGVGN